MVKRKPASSGKDLTIEHYDEIFADIAGLLEEARRTAARTVNAFMTATYWGRIGRLASESSDMNKGGENARDTEKNCSNDYLVTCKAVSVADFPNGTWSK